MEKRRKTFFEISIILQLACLTTVKGLSTIASSESLNQQHQQQQQGFLEDLSGDIRPGCYFSAEYQGEFVMQVNSPNSIASLDQMNQPFVQYSMLNISDNAIPVWGYCYKKVDDNYLLKDPRGGYGECIRCFRLARRSRNIIEVFSEELNQCYINEAGATESCKKLNSTSILYRTKEVGGGNIRNEYCPIAGKYIFRYNVSYDNVIIGENNEAVLQRESCGSYLSEINNCPDGSLLHLQFKRCSFENHDISLECLGSWPATAPDLEKGSQFVAFLDSRGADDYSGPPERRRPRYRCGLYHMDGKTGKSYLTLSRDSSCSHKLINASNGYETLILSKTTTQKNMPIYVRSNLKTFPRWAQGEWEETLIVNGTMTFNDLNGYKSFTFVTVDSNENTGRYIVFSRDHCENEAYVCLAMRQRSENVLEFTTGTVSSPIYQSFLCDDTNLQLNRSNAVWWTLARLERTEESPCPITGQYTGRITDLPGFCAELSSNCNMRQIMYYKVYDCKTNEVFEERTYICLGQWEEDGLTYTYSMRNDTGTNECFVGLIVNEDEIYIKEAGDYCIRNMDPKTTGMRLYRKGHCYGNSASPAPTIPTKPTSNDVPIMKIATPIRTVTTRFSSGNTRFGGGIKVTTTTMYPPNKKTSSGCFTNKPYLQIIVLNLLISSLHLTMCRF